MKIPFGNHFMLSICYTAETEMCRLPFLWDFHIHLSFYYCLTYHINPNERLCLFSKNNVIHCINLNEIPVCLYG